MATVIFEVDKIEASEQYHLIVLSWLSYFIYIYVYTKYCLTV